MVTGGEQMSDVRRLQLASDVGTELALLRTDTAAWSAYLADAESTTVTDGVTGARDESTSGQLPSA